VALEYSFVVGHSVGLGRAELSVRSGNGVLSDFPNSRYELKYLINEAQVVAIEEFIKPYVGLDPYSLASADLYCPTATMYLDTADFQLYRQGLQGWKNRFKLRIRSYSDGADCPRFFEIKRRVDRAVIKSRARVSSGSVASLLAGFSFASENITDNPQALNQFQMYMNVIRARPAVLVRYYRRAYKGDTADNLRITFDRNLCFKTAGDSEIALNGTGWNEVRFNGAILEIKFNKCYPAWVKQMVGKFQLTRRSLSKYVASVKKAGMLGFCASSLV